MSAASRLSALQAKLDYRCKDEALLVRALTHKSASRLHNERLEFLGDAVLGYVVGDYLHQSCRGGQQNVLSLLRASLIKRDTLAEVALAINLGEHLILGPGERRTGAHQRASILADTLEAIIGAVHEDGGIGAARALILHLFKDRLENLDEGMAKDPKTELQERVQARALELPAYRVLDIEGMDHEQVFNVVCELVDLGASVTATGSTRKGAEMRAAARMIGELESRERHE